jgi:hypothetical protein
MKLPKIIFDFTLNKHDSWHIYWPSFDTWKNIANGRRTTALTVFLPKGDLTIIVTFDPA